MFYDTEPHEYRGGNVHACFEIKKHLNHRTCLTGRNQKLITATQDIPI